MTASTASCGVTQGRVFRGVMTMLRVRKQKVAQLPRRMHRVATSWMVPGVQGCVAHMVCDQVSQGWALRSQKYDAASHQCSCTS